MEVTFEQRYSYEKSDTFLTFFAIANGREINCIISYEALQQLSGCDGLDMEPAFIKHRSVIEDLAKRMIQTGELTDGQVLITEIAFGFSFTIRRDGPMIQG